MSKNGPCEWCAWDCPSPEVALCAEPVEPPGGMVKAPVVSKSGKIGWMTNLPDISEYTEPEDEDG